MVETWMKFKNKEGGPLLLAPWRMQRQLRDFLLFQNVLRVSFSWTMVQGLDPLLVATLVYGVLIGVLYWSMDIHGASKALWSAYGQFADRVKHNRVSRSTSEPDFMGYSHLDGAEEQGDARPNPWPAEQQQGNPVFDFTALESGKFSEAEFLRKFGGRNPDSILSRGTEC